MGKMSASEEIGKRNQSALKYKKENSRRKKKSVRKNESSGESARPKYPVEFEAVMMERLLQLVFN